MRKNIILVVLGLAMVVILVFASCAQQTTTSTSTIPPESPTTTSESPTSTVPPTTPPATTSVTTQPVPTEANWWDKFGTPQYGGTLAIRSAMLSGGSFDPSAGMMGAGGMATNTWLQGLAFFDWTLDRNVWAYPTGFTPLEYYKGLLIDGWEQTDPLTITLNVHKGVMWQNKAPVNGREFTADDIKFNLERALKSPTMASGYSTIDSVVVSDKYTAQVKLKKPAALAYYQLLGSMMGFVPPEWVALAGPETETPSGTPSGGPPVIGGPLTDWKNVVGTGPFILTDFVQGTSMTLAKNTDYWQNDERYPDNKLPYIDTLKQIAIPDPATALAAMRTGQVDMWTDMMGAMTIQQGETLAKSNPEIQIINLPRPAGVVMLRVDTSPFTDIRVRKALQLTIDRPSIAQTYYKGSKYAQPVGLVSPVLKGFAVPYDQWPQDLKDEYSFNLAEARSLMTEAGYPNGFKTNCVASSDQDMQLLQLIKSEFMEIGVDMEIRQMDRGTYTNFLSAGKQDQMAYSDGMAGLVWSPANTLMRQVSTFAPQNNNTFSNDPVYDKMWEDWNAAATDADLKALSSEMDTYILRQHWNITILPSDTPVAFQPWVKGYSGEIVVDPSWAGAVRARIWIDQSLK